MSTEDIEHKLLFRCLSEKKWRDLSPTAFAEKYEEEVGDVSSPAITHVAHLPSFGFCSFHELPDGLTALDLNGKWSLFETEARAKNRDHFRVWAEFARGSWRVKVPSQPGRYFVKDKDLGKLSLRELKVVNGRLKDVSGGMVRAGFVSEWVGYWWVPAVPVLPESY